MQTLVTPMSCNALNIPMMHDKVVRLSKMEASLKHQLAGLSRERDKANLINGALFAARIVKASCDTILSVAGELAGSLGPAGKKVQLITKGYSHATVWAEIGTKAWMGQNVQSDITNYASKQAIGFGKKGIGGSLSRHTGMSQDVGSAVVDLQLAKGKLVVNAMKQEEDALLNDLMKYGEAFTQLVAAAGDNKKIGPIAGVGFALFDGGKEIVSAYKDFKNEDPDAMFASQQLTLTRLLNKTSDQIRILRMTIRSCAPEYHLG